VGAGCFCGVLLWLGSGETGSWGRRLRSRGGRWLGGCVTERCRCEQVWRGWPLAGVLPSQEAQLAARSPRSRSLSTGRSGSNLPPFLCGLCRLLIFIVFHRESSLIRFRLPGQEGSGNGARRRRDGSGWASGTSGEPPLVPCGCRSRRKGLVLEAATPSRWWFSPPSNPVMLKLCLLCLLAVWLCGQV